MAEDVTIESISQSIVDGDPEAAAESCRKALNLE